MEFDTPLQCPVCDSDLIEITENNGFEPPDPVHYDVIGWKCSDPDCNYREDL